MEKNEFHVDDLYLGRFRPDSQRLPGWNYANPGYYFVTICINNRNPYFFGYIENNKMILNNIGKIVGQYWLQIPEYSKNIVLDEYIVMPNHIHGIIKINGIHVVETLHCNVSTEIRNVSTEKNIINKKEFLSTISPKSGSLSAIIRSYKMACIKILKQKKYIPVSFWQPKFHDHIIRNRYSLNKIREYIKDNPENWEKDKLNPKLDFFIVL